MLIYAGNYMRFCDQTREEFKSKKIRILKNILHFFKRGTLLFCLIYCTAGIFAQDPEQYGKPYDGVPDAPDVVIYQVNMRCFSESGDFQGVINRMDHIADLGVNVLYLMPYYPVGTVNAFNSPYCIKDFTAVGTEFGTLNDLRALVDSAHNRGMAVMIDWVVNQTSWDHPWITEHKDWYEQDNEGNIQMFRTYSDVAALDLSNEEVKDAMIEAMRYWIFTANIDGFRMDVGDAPPVSFWEDVISNLRSIETHKLLLLSEGSRAENFSAGFDFNFGFAFYFNTLKSIFNGGSVAAINSINSSEYSRASDTQRVVRYLTNHDVYGSEGSPYDLFGGRDGVLASFVVITLMKSVPFIYNGLEVGNTVSIRFPFTGNDINWTEDETITPEMISIINIFHSIESARRGELTSYTNGSICAFKKEMGVGSEGIFVVVNMRDEEKTFTLPDQFANTTVKDLLTDAGKDLETLLTLAAYEYLIFSYEVIVSEKSSSIEEKNVVYPNPVADGVIHITLKHNNANVQVVVYDLQGKKIVESVLTQSENTVNVSRMDKGMYILTLFSAGDIYSEKLIVR